MRRYFIALDLPDLIKDSLSQLQDGLDDAHWRNPEGLHLTLAFLGQLDRHGVDDVIRYLSEVDSPSFSLTLAGLHSFGSYDPHTVWVGVEACEPLLRLQSKIAYRLRREQLYSETQKFIPHVTLGSVRLCEVAHVHQYTASHGLYKCGPFPIESFHLIESLRGKSEAHYEIVASFALMGSSKDETMTEQDGGQHPSRRPIRRPIRPPIRPPIRFGD